jgi:hypothetical protein
MYTYAFTALGQTKNVKADNALSAMLVANWKFPLGAGAWIENGKNAFKWVEGNFFN